MTGVTAESTPTEIAAIVSDALQDAGIAATLSGGGAVSVYTDNEYESKDLDFVTAAMQDSIAPVMQKLGFVTAGEGGSSAYDHPAVEWYVEFVSGPLSFGEKYVSHEDCAVIDVGIGKIRIITPTQSVMDRLAAAIHWKDPQSRDQAVRVAANQDIDWQELEEWFGNEGEPESEFARFRRTVERARQR